MKYKLFGIVWDVRPILVFIWYMFLLWMASETLIGMFERDNFVVFSGFVACMLWAYITHTLVRNGFLDSGKDEQ